MENTLLNLIPAAYLPEVHISQYDIGRTLTFNLKEGASDYNVPTGATVTVKATKPSGFGFAVPCTFSGGVVTLVVTETMTPEHGRFPAELSIVSGNTTIGTSNFIFNIERSPHPEGTIDGDAETIIPELTLLVERIEAAASSVLDMQVVADTLPPGSQATYSYDEELNKATFGIPQGEPGAGAVGTVASAYDASKTYAVGDYAIHNNDLYRCITAITTAETFTASHWTKIVLADDVTDLKSDFTEGTRNLNVTGSGRYSANTNTGVITQNDSNRNIWGMKDKIPCLPDTDYVINYFDINTPNVAFYACYYDENGGYISNSYFNAQRTVALKTPNNAYYIYSFLYGSNISLGNDPRIQVEKGTVPTDFVDPHSAIDTIAREETGTLFDKLTIPIDITETPGLISDNGVISPASSTYLEAYTNKIDVSKVEKLNFELSLTANKEIWIAYAAYDAAGAFISRNLVTIGLRANSNVAKGFITVPDNVHRIALTYRTYGIATMVVSAVNSIPKIVNSIKDVDTDVVNGNRSLSSIGSYPCRFKPFYDHLFINTINGVDVIIPSESLFNIQISRRLGFNMIEANVHDTSDGHYIVMHGENNRFGQQVEHVDGVTDISNTLINSVTLAWIKENVRYKAIYPKYRVAPPSLEEFLYECRKNCMIPLATMPNADVAKILNDIMGKDNYVAYNGNRTLTSAPIFTWSSTATTKEEILAICDAFGVPCMYNMLNPASFTDAEIKEIVDLLHEHGYWIGLAGCYETEATNQRLMALGFDFSASGWHINEFESGNLCNLSADIDYSDFTTNGTVTNNLLTLTAGQTIEPNATLPTVFLGGGSLHIRFKGKIKINMGSYINNQEIESDGSQSLWFSTFFMRQIPTFSIEAVTSTEVLNIDYKASKM